MNTNLEFCYSATSDLGCFLSPSIRVYVEVNFCTKTSISEKVLNPANKKENKCIFGTKKFCNAFKLIMVYDLDKGRYYVQFDFKSTLVVFTTVRLRSSITWSGDEC